MRNWSFKKHAVLSTVIVAAIGISEILIDGIDIETKGGIISKILSAFSGNEAKSIGIIGGADGPTAVFIAEKSNVSMVPTKLLLLIILLMLYKPMKKFICRS